MFKLENCDTEMRNETQQSRSFMFESRFIIQDNSKCKVKLTLQPSEQKRNMSKRLLPQTWQTLDPPLPDLGCGRSFRNKTFALFITYVCTSSIFNTFSISETLTTSWYDDLLICAFIQLVKLSARQMCEKTHETNTNDFFKIYLARYAILIWF